AEDGIRDGHVTGVQTCALPISVDETFFHQVQFEDSPMVGMLPVDRDSIRPGLNLQLDEIPCAVGRIAMKSLDEWNERRRQFARRSEERRVGKECRSGWAPYDTT